MAREAVRVARDARIAERRTTKLDRGTGRVRGTAAGLEAFPAATGSLPTRRWREMDSNFQFRDKQAAARLPFDQRCAARPV